MLDEWILEIVGEWITDYPYLYATAEFLFILIAFIFLSNLLYWLGKLLAGER